MLKIVVDDSRISALGVITSGIKLNLVENDSVIGKATLQYDNCFILTEFEVFDKDYEKEVFFFRSIVYKLGSTGQKLKVLADDRLVKYGFKQDNEYMQIDCKDAVYPSTCKD